MNFIVTTELAGNRALRKHLVRPFPESLSLGDFFVLQGRSAHRRGYDGSGRV